jgi:hypothetical protein
MSFEETPDSAEPNKTLRECLSKGSLIAIVHLRCLCAMHAHLLEWMAYAQ